MEQKLNNERESLKGNLSKDGLKRQQVIDNIAVSLEIAVEEMKLKNEKSELLDEQNTRELAMEIESNVFIQHNDKTD